MIREFIAQVLSFDNEEVVKQIDMSLMRLVHELAQVLTE